MRARVRRTLWKFGRHIITCTIIGMCLFFAADLFAEEAKLRWTADEDMMRLSFATRYSIYVSALANGLSFEQLRDKQTFSLIINDTGKPVAITAVTESGSSETIEGTDYYNKAHLWGDFRPDVIYKLAISYPDGTLSDIEVKVSEDIKPKRSSIIRKIGDRLAVDLDIEKVEDTDALAFAYNLNIYLFSLHGFRTSLSANGEVGTDAEDKKIQSSMTEGLNVDYRFHPKIAWRIPKPEGQEEKRTYSYPIGFRIKPAELEHNQSFDLANYTVKGQVVLSVPVVLEYPVFWWHAQRSINRPFYPPLIYAGYTYSSEINDDKDLQKDEESNRFDLELVYSFPVSDMTDFSVRWRAFYSLDGDGNNDLLELSAKTFLDRKRTTGFVLKYEDGALPPEFKSSSTIRAGWLYEFF